MSLRILFAIHGPRDAKTAVFLTVSRRAAFLQQQGHSVDILTPADFALGRWARLMPVVLPVALAARDLRNYDVVIFHSHLAWAHQLRTFWRRARAAKPATVVAFHGLEPLYHEALAAELSRTGERLSRRFHLLHRVLVPRLLGFACRGADRVFCLNSEERVFVIAQGWADRTRVVVLPNGVEKEMFLQQRIHKSRATRILFTGQWLRAKGIRYLAEAFHAIAASSPEAELTCVGTGVDAELVLQDFAAGVRTQVRVLPRVGREELRRELARADAFMFPSLSEGFSGALLEAMASGLPVIATAAGAARDLLKHEDNALVVPFGDSAALVAAVARLADDPCFRRQLGTAAQATACHYEWDRVNQSFAAEVQQVAAGAA
jgi:glycosyltransferase involved in cell wall biosynthesis